MNIDLLIKESILAKNGSAKEAYRAIKTELLDFLSFFWFNLG